MVRVKPLPWHGRRALASTTTHCERGNERRRVVNYLASHLNLRSWWWWRCIYWVIEQLSLSLSPNHSLNHGALNRLLLSRNPSTLLIVLHSRYLIFVVLVFLGLLAAHNSGHVVERRLLLIYLLGIKCSDLSIRRSGGLPDLVLRALHELFLWG